MRITKIYLQNFKSIGKQQSFDLKPITLLFGPNSVGKSTVLKSLVFLRALLENGDADIYSADFMGEKIDFGGFKNTIYKNDTENTMGIGVKLDLHERIIPDDISTADEYLFDRAEWPWPSDYFSEAKEITFYFNIHWDAIKAKPVVQSYLVYLNDELLMILKPVAGLNNYAFTYFNHTHKVIQEVEDTFFDEKEKLDEFKFQELCDTCFADITKFVDIAKNKNEISETNISVAELEEQVNIAIADETNPGELTNLLYFTLFKSTESFFFGKSENKEEEQMNEKLRQLREKIKITLNRLKSNINANWEDVEPYSIAVETESLNGALPDFQRTQTIASQSWNDEGYFDNFLVPSLTISNFFSGFSSGSLRLLLEKLQALTYIGPIRTIPNRQYRPEREQRFSRWVDGSGAWDYLYRIFEAPNKENEKALENINYWLAKKLDSGYEIESEELIPSNKKTDSRLIHNKQYISLKDIYKGINLSAKDVGVGISQVIPVLVAALKYPDSFVAIEQPELHIHPRMQVELADLFIYLADQGGQAIIETHSEHLILRLLRRIREATENELDDERFALTTKDIGVVYLEPNEKGAKFTMLAVTEDGDFEEKWPSGFFAERSKELF